MQYILIIFILHTSQIPLPPYLLSTSRSYLFLKDVFIIYMSFACMDICISCVCLVSVESEEGIRFLTTGVTDGHVLCHMDTGH